MSDPKEWGGKFDEDDAAELTDSTVEEVQEAWHAARDDAEDDDDNAWEGDRHAQDEDVEEYEDDPWDGEDE